MRLDLRKIDDMIQVLDSVKQVISGPDRESALVEVVKKIAADPDIASMVVRILSQEDPDPGKGRYLMTEDPDCQVRLDPGFPARPAPAAASASGEEDPF